MTTPAVPAGSPSPSPSPSPSLSPSPPLSDGQPNYVLHQTIPAPHSRHISSLKWSPSGNYLASSSSDGSVRLYSSTFDTNTAAVKTQASSPTFQFPQFNICASLERGHELGINDVAWSHDSKTLCTASDDKTLVLWDVDTRRPLRTLRGHTSYVFCVAFNPASNLLVSGSFDESIRIWEVKTGTCKRTLGAHSDPVAGVDFNRDGKLIVSASYDGLCRVWDTQSGQCLKTIYYDKTPPVSFVKFSPNGKYLLTSNLDSTLRLWNYLTGKCLKEYRSHKNESYASQGAFSVTHTYGKYVVAGSEDTCIYIWDVQTRHVLQKLTGHTDVVIGVSCHPHINLIASAAMEKDGSIRIWKHQHPTLTTT